MDSKNVDQFKKAKEALEKFGYHFEDEQIFEVVKSIQELSNLIVNFEKNKKNGNYKK